MGLARVSDSLVQIVRLLTVVFAFYFVTVAASSWPRSWRWPWSPSPRRYRRLPAGGG